MDFNKAIELDLDIPRTYYDRGNAYYSNENYKQAEIDYLKAIDLETENFLYWVELGKTYEVLGFLTMAVEMFNKAISFDIYNSNTLDESISEFIIYIEVYCGINYLIIKMQYSILQD